jgi:hypothetical protein
MSASKYKAICALVEFLRKNKYRGQDGDIIQNSRQVEQNFDIKEYDKEEVIHAA